MKQKRVVLAFILVRKTCPKYWKLAIELCEERCVFQEALAAYASVPKPKRCICNARGSSGLACNHNLVI